MPLLRIYGMKLSQVSAGDTDLRLEAGDGKVKKKWDGAVSVERTSDPHPI